jgi:hypothetical protein
MIVISSTEEDVSTNKVIDWLAYHYKIPYQRVNGLEWFNDKSVSTFRFNNTSEMGDIECQDTNLSLDKVTAVWFRKDRTANFSKDVTKGEEVNKQVNRHLNEEYFYAKEGLYRMLIQQSNQVIGHRIITEPQKIDVLLEAKKIGIDIPDTLVTNNKEDLLAFYKEHNGAITKPIKESRVISDEKVAVGMYVSNISEEELNHIPKHFFVSLFQERLDIVFDIRVFYLDGQFYPIAIFTPKKDTSRVDVRAATSSDMEFRETRYQLTEALEQQLTQLMDVLDLVSGSIDLIHTQDGRTVFLEVNPWGQYGNVSRSGNYFINEKVADYLVTGSKR